MPKEDIQKIADEIKGLIDELVKMSAVSRSAETIPKKTKGGAIKKGAAGALSILITDEGFFDEPKNIASVMNKLKEMGRYYPQPSVAMNLLNLTRRRVLSRFPDKETKGWQYVIRK